MTLYAIDPGDGYYGCAVFVGTPMSSTHLGSAGYVSNDDCVAALSDDEAVCEEMDIYTRSGGISTKSLKQVLLSSGRITAQFSKERITYVLPREWKGQQTKEVNHLRTLRTLQVRGWMGWGGPELAKQTARIAAGKGAAGKLEHTFDAIGIGLWYLQTKGSL